MLYCNILVIISYFKKIAFGSVFVDIGVMLKYSEWIPNSMTYQYHIWLCSGRNILSKYWRNLISVNTWWVVVSSLETFSIGYYRQKNCISPSSDIDYNDYTTKRPFRRPPFDETDDSDILLCYHSFAFLLNKMYNVQCDFVPAKYDGRWSSSNTPYFMAVGRRDLKLPQIL